MKHASVLIPVLGLWFGHSSAAHADEKSEGTALSLSVVPVIAGFVGMIVASNAEDGPLDDDPSTAKSVAIAGAFGVLALGPSVGHWYAGELWSVGLALRAGGVASALTAVAFGKHGHDDIGIGFAIGANALFAGGVVYDLWTVRSVVRKRNHHEPSAMIVPVVGDTTGLAFATTF